MKTVSLVFIKILLVMSFSSMHAAKKPNILFIMSDDHTSQALGVYGSRLAPLNPTPTIDRLGHEGMRFDNVFCNNSICTPSRASIITGQYPLTNGVRDLDGSIAPENQYLPIEINRLGYGWCCRRIFSRQR